MYGIVRKQPLLGKRSFYDRAIISAGFDEIPIITLCKIDFHNRILVATKVTSNGSYRLSGLYSRVDPKAGRVIRAIKRERTST
jgi:hypothetical protein